MNATTLATALVLLAAVAVPADEASATTSPVPQAQQDTTKPKNPLQEGLPLEPARELSGTFREGSWLSVDVSPDGRTLVFDLLGDLYTLPIEGGRARALTRGMAMDVQPRFSPDGRHIAFVSDRSGNDNVWIIATDLSDTTQVTKDETGTWLSPEWAPDGDYLVATREVGGLGKLWLLHRRGGAGAGLIREPQNLRTLGAAFGPDGRRVWHARRTGGWQYNSGMRDYQLAVYDRETGESTVQTFRYGGGFRPTLSPDGRWLVYGTRHVGDTALRIRNLETGDERWLAYPVQRDEQESFATRDVLPGMAFTPDSRSVIASWGGRLWRVPVDGGDAAEIPFEAPVEVPIGPLVDFDYEIPDDATFTVKQIRDAAPSPDGRRIAFTALDRLYVMDWPDGRPRRVAEMAANQHMPAWSPDGAWLVFSTWSREDGGHLYRTRADGGGAPERLTRQRAIWIEPAWSPDGERVVALRAPERAYDEALQRAIPGGANELVWLPARGGATSLVTHVDDAQRPHFTADSDRIWLHDGDDGLVSMRWDGTDRREHVKVQLKLPGANEPTQAELIVMAPRGDRALAYQANDVYVVTVPVTGGEVPVIDVSDPANAALPARKLTDIGAQFPAWSGDGERVHWSVGNAHFVYDLDAAEAFRDSVEAEVEGEEEVEGDTAAAGASAPRYRPVERRVAIQAERDMPRGVAVLRGARVITMRGDEVIEDGDVVVRDNRIVAVGRRGSVQVPEGAEVIDVSGKTIVPGFVDTHAHLRGVAGIHRDQIWAFAANLAYGVTTTRDPQTGTTDVLTYEDKVRAGEVLGPRIFSTGPGVFFSEQIKSLDDARDVLRRYSDYYDTKTIKMYGAGNRQVRQWIIEAAREQRLMPTTEGGLNAKMNLTMAIDGYSGMEHNMPGFPFFDDVVQLFATSKIAYTPTILVTYGGPWAENYWYATEDVFGDEKLRTFTPFEELAEKALRRPGPGPGSAGWFHPLVHTLDRVAEFVDDLVDAGGRAGVGSHGQLQGLGYHWELWSVASGGLAPHDALRVATLIGAESLGLDTELGSIEPGKLADLVILDANPLDDIRNTNTVDRVMIGGRLHEGDTLDEVWPRQREAGPFYWQRGALPGGAAVAPAAR